MKIEWNKVTWYSKLIAVVLFLCVFGIGYYSGLKNAENIKIDKYIKSISILPITNPLHTIDGKYCFNRNQIATKTEPYSSQEHIILNILDNKVIGTKKGNQSGPDMTNGYEGELSGSINNNELELLYSYIIEGSKGKELEIYNIKDNSLIKKRWVLEEKGGVLTPNKKGEPKLISYSKEDCNIISNIKPEQPIANNLVPKGKLPIGSLLPVDFSKIQSSTWFWEKTVMSNNITVIPKKANMFSITFSLDGNMSGKTDCNGFSGSYKIGSDGVITFGSLASTLMYCEGSQEQVFSNAVGMSNRYMLDPSGNLVLLLPYDSGSILFKK